MKRFLIQSWLRCHRFKFDSVYQIRPTPFCNLTAPTHGWNQFILLTLCCFRKRKVNILHTELYKTTSTNSCTKTVLLWLVQGCSQRSYRFRPCEVADSHSAPALFRFLSGSSACVAVVYSVAYWFCWRRWSHAQLDNNTILFAREQKRNLARTHRAVYCCITQFMS